MNKELKVLTLKAIAALAAKLANDVENNRLWEGEYSEAVSQLRRQLESLPKETS